MNIHLPEDDDLSPKDLQITVVVHLQCPFDQF